MSDSPGSPTDSGQETASSRPRSVRKVATERGDRKSTYAGVGSSAIPEAQSPPSSTSPPTNQSLSNSGNISLSNSTTKAPTSSSSPTSPRGSITSPNKSFIRGKSERGLEPGRATLSPASSSIIQAAHSERTSKLMGSGNNKTGFWGSLFGTQQGLRNIEEVNEENISQHLEGVMEELKFSVNAKEIMRNESYAVKLGVIKDFIAQKKDQEQPLEYIAALKKKPQETLELLVFTLKTESSGWAHTFLRHGGLEILMQIMLMHAKKVSMSFTSKRKDKDTVSKEKTLTNIIQNVILAVKGLLQHDDGVEAMILKPNYTVLFIQVLPILNERMQIVTLHLIAGIASLDENLHSHLIPILEKQSSSMVSMCSSTNNEVAAAAFTCLNSLVFAPQHDSIPIGQINKLKHIYLNNGLGNIAKEWRSRKNLAESMQTQLDVLEMNLELDLDAYATNSSAVDDQDQIDQEEEDENQISLAESPKRLFEKVLDKVKTNPPIHDAFLDVLVSLLKLSTSGKPGYNKWDLVSLFVKSVGMVDDSTSIIRDKLLASALENMTVIEKANKADGSLSASSKSVPVGTTAPGGKNGPSRWQTASRKASGVRRTQWIEKAEPIGRLKELLRIEEESEKSVNKMSADFYDKGQTENQTKPPETTVNTPTTQEGVPPPPGGPPPPPPPPGSDPNGPPLPPGVPPPPPPPPPPGGKENMPKKSQSVVPLAKVRPLYWNKINHFKMKGTLWEEMTMDVPLPRELLESEFCYVAKEKQSAKPVDPNDVKTIILFDSKRWQNTSIMLSRFISKQIPYRMICDGILNMDEKVLSMDDIQAISSFTPQDQDAELLAPYLSKDGSEIPPNLGEPEKYTIALMSIPNVRTRLKCWLTKLNFASQFLEVKTSVETLLRACVEVKKSTNFKKILEIVLAFGNFLNHDTQRGGAFGFRLNTLLQLGDVRSHSDPKNTLLHTIVEYLSNTFPETLEFSKEIVNCEGASQLKEMSFLSGELKTLKDSISEIQEFMNKPDSKVGKFSDTMNEFLPTSTALVAKIEALFSKAQSLYNDLVNFYGEAESASKSFGDFFGTVFGFSVAFEKAVDDLKRRKIVEEKKRLAAMEREKREALRQANQQQNAQGKANKFRQAMDDLTSGQAYLKKRGTLDNN